jgi:hypothetical protein
MQEKPTKTMRYGLVAASLMQASLLWPGQAAAYDKANPDWPCVQRKVVELTAAQMWDGPPIDKNNTEWLNHDEIRNLARTIISRRIPLPDAEKAIKEFAAKYNGKERNEKLTLLFTGALNLTNDERKTVMNGIERFQKRQVARAEALEKEGVDIAKLKTGEAAEVIPDRPLTPEEQKYHWDARIFQERQQNLPLACEIPELIGQRIYEIAKLIRAQMQDEAPPAQ